MTYLRSFLHNITIKPLEFIFEWIFSIACQITLSPGFSIIILSLLMNILLLPMYKRADAIQEEEHQLEVKMRTGVEHIKKTFKGDEAFMMLQTYYRQHNYKPSYALRGSLPLLLEIPFFIAAYRFISGMTLLNGISFGPIKNLGVPDASFMIGAFPVNVLPILMTLINIISGLIFSKGYALKTKIQIFTMAGLFLVVLYQSPSALVLYWTMNNLFSLIKNIVTKIREKQTTSETAIKAETAKGKQKHAIFWISNILLTLLCGILIPSAVIHSSPEEFYRVHTGLGPIYYIFYTFSLCVGLFVVWFGIFFALADQKRKRLLSMVASVLCVVSLVNYMAFATKLGNISPFLRFDAPFMLTISETIINILVILALIFLVTFLYKKKEVLLQIIMISGIVAVISMSTMNIHTIHQVLQETALKFERIEEPKITLSKNSKNVIVLMLDRAVSENIPYIFQEKSQLKEQFSGFTYYPNTLSYSTHTNTASPALYGGYEYTPEELNKRDSEKLEDKHHEALKIMPTLFSENNYDVTIFDPPYAGYTWTPDLSVFDEIAHVKAYNTRGFYTNTWPELSLEIENTWRRNFFSYSLMKISPLAIQPLIYNKGNYIEWRFPLYYAAQAKDDSYELSTNIGYNIPFLDSYLVLDKMRHMTNIVEDGKNQFLMMANETTHEPTLLQKPNYTPQYLVDNSAYDSEDDAKRVIDGIPLPLETKDQRKHYHINITSMLQLASWFDYLRENEIYDNTRIILVSDHGYGMKQYEEHVLSTGVDTAAFNCLLMVKDFDAKEFRVDKQFMTNADVPELATRELLTIRQNPFTGQSITQNKKEGVQKVFFSDHWVTSINNGTTFIEDDWYEVDVRDEGANVLDPANWRYIGKE